VKQVSCCLPCFSFLALGSVCWWSRVVRVVSSSWFGELVGGGWVGGFRYHPRNTRDMHACVRASRVGCD
jgi:hypothetical protein